MRPLLVVLAAAVLVLGVAAPADARPLPVDWRLHPCGSPTRANPPADVDAALHAAADEAQVSYSLLRAIARGESAFNPGARNRLAGGIAQHLFRYYPGRVASFNRAHPATRAAPSIFDLAGNLRVTAWMIAQGQARAWRCR